MTILWGFKRLMLSHTGFSRLETSLAEALVCKPELVRNVWQELQLDSYEDVHDIKQLGSRHFANYKKTRLNKVSPSTFRRQYSLLLAIMRHAEQEWQWASPISCATKITLPNASRKAIERISEADENLYSMPRMALKTPI